MDEKYRRIPTLCLSNPDKDREQSLHLKRCIRSEDGFTSSAPYHAMASKDYIKAVQRGRCLLSELDRPPSLTTASIWTAFSSLAEQGWVQEISSSGARFDVTSIMKSSLPDIAPHDYLNGSGSKSITWRHKAASYTQRFHPAGIVFATSLRSPEVSALMVRESLRDPLPNLHHWSDITFLQWMELTEDVPSMRKTLQKVVHCGVTNLQTLKVIKEVLGISYAMSLPYPGRVFTKDVQEEVFAALLGTPSAVGTGFLLAQHKEQLGWMVVNSVQIYTDIGWYMVINVGQKRN